MRLALVNAHVVIQVHGAETATGAGGTNTTEIKTHVKTWKYLERNQDGKIFTPSMVMNFKYCELTKDFEHISGLFSSEVPK